MADFLTHIELHDASDADYAKLDSAMDAANFSRTVRSGRGVPYRMPTATYFSQSFGMSSSDVRNLAMLAARQTGRTYDIVTTSGDLSFFLHPAA